MVLLRQSADAQTQATEKSTDDSRSEPSQEKGELRAPNGRLACLYDGLWLGMLCSEGRARGSKIYAGFEVQDDNRGGLTIKKLRTFDRRTPEYKFICRHYYGRDTSPTPMQVFITQVMMEGRVCQLFTL